MQGLHGRGTGSAFGGLLRQNTARAEPPTAINTTDTAEGTATRGSAKCVRASRKPSAALCMPAHHVLSASLLTRQACCQ